MRFHIRFLLLASLVWAGFWVAGLPSYYQQYTTPQMICFALVVLVPITVIAYLFLRRIRPAKRLPVALWLAFYFTVPLAIFDWLYCGLYLRHGVQFLWKYWYLTVYYAIPWILLPATALFLNRRVSSGGPRPAARF